MTRPAMPRRFWTEKENKMLRRLYADHHTKDIAKQLDRTMSGTYGQAKKLGLSKSQAFLKKFCRMQKGSQIGKDCRFKPGQIPPNKGKKMPGYAPGRMAQTQFKKGQRPRNTVPIGTIVKNTDGYLRIKVADVPESIAGKGGSSTNWEFIHRQIWEAAHGPIAPGHRIWWKDGNHDNNALENLELLTDEEHMRRTTIHNLPPELKDTIQLAGRVKRAIRKRVKNDASQKQS